MKTTKSPTTIGDVVNNSSSHPTTDDWHPSCERGYEIEPQAYDTCECWECMVLPKHKQQEEAKWDWKCGGKVDCRLYVFDSPTYITSKPGKDDLQYMARVSFWGLDDTGMEKFFEYEEDARRFVCHLPSFISMEWLRSEGFWWC